MVHPVDYSDATKPEIVRVSKTYILSGNPVPLHRGRVYNNKVYDDQKHQKVVSGIEVINQHDRSPKFSGPVHMTVVFYMPNPKGFKRKGLHHFKPDLSNLIKYVEDVMTGVVYNDDAQIASINASKEYSKHKNALGVSVGRTEITISTVESYEERKDEKPPVKIPLAIAQRRSKLGPKSIKRRGKKASDAARCPSDS